MTLKQLRIDFNYLNDNINNYLVNEDGLVNYVFVNMTSGTMDMKEFLLWCINDLVSHVIYDSEDEESRREFY